VPSEESTSESNQPNLRKSPQKETSDKRTEKEQKSPQTTIVLQSSNTSDASCHTSPMVLNDQ